MSWYINPFVVLDWPPSCSSSSASPFSACTPLVILDATYVSRTSGSTSVPGEHVHGRLSSRRFGCRMSA
eukprot:9449461-Pyramimonas_sp.AAC.1